MYKILVAIPTYESISTETYESIWNLTKQINIDVDFKSIKGYAVDRARNEAVEYFLSSDKNYSHLMMVDSDIILPKLIETDPLYVFNILSNENISEVFLGWYPRKKEPTKTEMFMTGFDGYPAAARWNCSELKRWPQEIIYLKGGGFGCAIIKREVLETIEFPYFRYELRDDNTYISEDLYFCNKVNKYGYHICTKRSFACDHVGRKIIKAM